jgi:hypothetical protein
MKEDSIINLENSLEYLNLLLILYVGRLIIPQSKIFLNSQQDCLRVDNLELLLHEVFYPGHLGPFLQLPFSFQIF